MSISWIKALEVTDTSIIKELMMGGLSYGVYSNLSKYFIGNDVGWAQAAGIVKSLYPNFNSLTFGDAYWKQQESISQRDFITTYDPYKPLPEDAYIETDLDQPARYRYIGEFTYVDELSGEKQYSYLSYYSNEQLSQVEAGQFLFDSFDEDIYKEWRYVKNIRVVNIEHNETWDY